MKFHAQTLCSLGEICENPFRKLENIVITISRKLENIAVTIL